MRFIVGLPTNILSSEDREALRSCKEWVGGIATFKRNYLGFNAEKKDFDIPPVPYGTWLNQYKKLITDFSEAIERPIFFNAIDHEGGRVVRPPLPITRFPYCQHWKERTKEVIDAMATELTSLGVNWYYGPVVDINSNPANPVIGERAFSSNPQEVIQQARIALAALKAHRFLACIKHFPGHGDTETDSHFSLPVINHPKALLDERELLPYKALKDDAPCIMTAHIVFKELDPTRSGTFSPLININLLRKEIGFNGIIVTDDLGMDAVRDEILGKDGARLLLESGCDIFCATLNIPISAIARISFEMEALIRKEAKYKEMHEASLERISKALGALRMPSIEPLTDAVFQQHHALAETLNLDIAKRRTTALNSSFGD